MSWYRRATSSFSIGLGLLFIIAGIHELNDRGFYRHRHLDDSISYMLVGATLTGSGVMTKRSLRLQKQQQERDRLRSILYGLLRQTDTITVLQFAIAAQVAGEIAKQFLEHQAQVFSAEYEVSDRGEMIYRFPGSQLPPLMARAEEPIAAAAQSTAIADGAIESKMYDVVLYSCPSHQRIATIKAIRDLTGMSLKRARDLIDSVPQPVMQNIPRDLAEAYVHRLERAGATVTLSRHVR